MPLDKRWGVPLIPALSRNLALARLPLKRCHIRKRIWPGRGDAVTTVSACPLSPWGGPGGLEVKI
jgi:hypothetical protein